MSLVCDQILSIDLLVRVRDVNVISKQFTLNDVVAICFAAINERRFCERIVRLQVLGISNDNLSAEHLSFRGRFNWVAESIASLWVYSKVDTMAPHTLIAVSKIKTFLAFVDELWIYSARSMIEPLCLYFNLGILQPLMSDVLKLSLEGIPVSKVLNSLYLSNGGIWHRAFELFY